MDRPTHWMADAQHLIIHGQYHKAWKLWPKEVTPPANFASTDHRSFDATYMDFCYSLIHHFLHEPAYPLLFKHLPEDKAFRTRYIWQKRSTQLRNRAWRDYFLHPELNLLLGKGTLRIHRCTDYLFHMQPEASAQLQAHLARFLASSPEVFALAQPTLEYMPKARYTSDKRTHNTSAQLMVHALRLRANTPLPMRAAFDSNIQTVAALNEYAQVKHATREALRDFSQQEEYSRRDFDPNTFADITFQDFKKIRQRAHAFFHSNTGATPTPTALAGWKAYTNLLPVSARAFALIHLALDAARIEQAPTNFKSLLVRSLENNPNPSKLFFSLPIESARERKQVLNSLQCLWSYYYQAKHEPDIELLKFLRDDCPLPEAQNSFGHFHLGRYKDTDRDFLYTVGLAFKQQIDEMRPIHQREIMGR